MYNEYILPPLIAEARAYGIYCFCYVFRGSNLQHKNNIVKIHVSDRELWAANKLNKNTVNVNGQNKKNTKKRNNVMDRF